MNPHISHGTLCHITFVAFALHCASCNDDLDSCGTISLGKVNTQKCPATTKKGSKECRSYIVGRLNWMCRVVGTIGVLHHSFALCCTEALLRSVTWWGWLKKKHNTRWISFSLSLVSQRNLKQKRISAKTRNKDNDNLVPSGCTAARPRAGWKPNLGFVPLK